MPEALIGGAEIDGYTGSKLRDNQVYRQNTMEAIGFLFNICFLLILKQKPPDAQP